MPFAPAFLCAACPWCGTRNLAPVGTPIRELETLLESRCRSCRGGVCARTSWETFACFCLAYALVSDLTLYLVAEGHLGPSAASGTVGMIGWSAVVIGTMVALSRFLIMNSALRRGTEPARRE